MAYLYKINQTLFSFISLTIEFMLYTYSKSLLLLPSYLTPHLLRHVDRTPVSR
jgi:hypothetical protein